MLCDQYGFAQWPGETAAVDEFLDAHGSLYDVKAITQEGELVAIGEAVLPNLYHPILVL